MKTVNIAETGKKLKRMRKARGLSTYQVRDMLNLTSRGAIYKWERGECLPRVDNLLILADIYGVSMEEMLVIYEV